MTPSPSQLLTLTGLASVQEWLGGLLQREGESIYRMKGVLNVAHAPCKFVMHGVHMLVEGSYQEPWGESEPRESKLVFIGKGLDAAELHASFDACLANAANARAKIAKLRFTIDDEVECAIGGGWDRGRVVQLLYREDNMPAGMVAPYQIELEDGGLIYAPADNDCVIRRAGE